MLLLRYAFAFHNGSTRFSQCSIGDGGGGDDDSDGGCES